MNTVILSTSMVKHCDHCGKDGHEKKNCLKWERERREQSERDKAKNLERVANETTEKEKGQQRSQRKGGEDVRKKFPCVLFMKQGKCSYGDKCAYSHDTELAKSFKEKKCRDGKNCTKNANNMCCFGIHETIDCVDSSYAALEPKAYSSEPLVLSETRKESNSFHPKR